jgi:hypothetical protein
VKKIVKLGWSLFCHIFMKSHFSQKLLFFFTNYGRFLLHSDQGVFLLFLLENYCSSSWVMVDSYFIVMKILLCCFFVSGWHFLLCIIGIVMAIMVNVSSHLLLMLSCRRIRMSCSQFYNHFMQFVLGFEAKLLLIIITTPIKIHLYVFENSFPLSLWSPNPPSSFENKIKFTAH